ncbi:MAG: M55 family metallopeptidase [Chloroflexi bacterium]|nr:M55 family metallopeptidase [Chloroflexota bacterium]
MRVLIMCDMEGVSGIVTWDQVGGGKAGYPEGRELYTAEVNAAVRGAARAGATEIIVIDGHNAGGDWRYNSLLKGMLDPACDYVAHHTWTHYREPLEQGADACLMVGYHARNNTPDGVLNHTISFSQCRNLWFNNDLVGEIGVNAALCGHYGCPVLMVTGDVAACREATELVGAGLKTVAVKRGLSKFSARQIAPQRARTMIEACAYEALQDLNAVAPYVPSSPVTITAEFGHTDVMMAYTPRHDVELDLPAEKVIGRGDTWLEAWDKIWPWENMPVQ